MLRLLALCGVVYFNIVPVEATGDIGPGIWSVKYINKCEEESHKFKFDVTKKKINRTHDGFDASFILEEDFTEDYGVRVDICKEVDGGCKQYQVLSDDSFINFVNKYAKNNVKTCLEMGNVDPPEFPLKKGEYSVNDYVFDYSELPSDGVYGEFCARGYMLLDTEEMGCVEMFVEFIKDEEKK